MTDEGKGFLIFIGCFLIAAIAIAASTSYSNYLFTMRQKDCISAGYEWVHLPNFTEMECRKVTK
jgi:hypothetical protein